MGAGRPCSSRLWHDSHALTSAVFLPGSYGANIILLPGAAAVCSTVTPLGEYKGSLACWNLPDGRGIPVPAELKNDIVTGASTNAPVVIAERWGYHTWDLLNYSAAMFDAIVMDIHSGRRLATLKPRLQHGNYASRTNFERGYFQYALSPAGDYLAEAGDAELSLFRFK